MDLWVLVEGWIGLSCSSGADSRKDRVRADSGSAKFATRLLRHARLERWFNCPAQVWAMENTSAFFIRSTTSVDLGVCFLRVAFFECVYFGKREATHFEKPSVAMEPGRSF